MPYICYRTENGLEALQTLLGLNQHEIEDVLLVAIDFEGAEIIQASFQPDPVKQNGPEINRMYRNTQLGTSVLDTRDLKLQLEQPQQIEAGASSIISTQSFCTGSLIRWKAILEHFKFGITEAISVYDIADRVRQALKVSDDNSEFRKIVVVGHEVECEIRTLDSLRLCSHDLEEVVSVLDTTLIAKEVFPSRGGRSMSLLNLCSELGVPCHKDDHHLAGNDANFTLRVLLLLVARSYEGLAHEGEGDEARLIDLLQKLGQKPLPPPMPLFQLGRLIAPQPKKPLDDPDVPIDPSYFKRQKLFLNGR